MGVKDGKNAIHRYIILKVVTNVALAFGTTLLAALVIESVLVSQYEGTVVCVIALLSLYYVLEKRDYPLR
jgi:ABC-type bacteriocin/lantibiotic exporter with double-glycine peptidase domain